MKNKKLLLTGLATLSCCGLLASCKSNDNKKKIDDNNLTTVVTDTLGRKVEVKKDIKKVYCVGAGSLRLYSYIADLDKLCAIEAVEQGKNASPINKGAMVRPYQLANEEKFSTIKTAGLGGPKAQQFNNELLSNINADVIFSTINATADKVDENQQKIGTPIISLNYGGEDLMLDEQKSIINSLRIIGDVMGESTKKKANSLIDYMHSLTNELKTYTNTIKETDKPSVYIGGLAFWGQQAFYSSDVKYAPFKLAGVKNYLADKTPEQIGKVNNVNREVLISGKGPDKIILDCGGLELVADQFAKKTPDADLIKSITAVKNGEVYLQPTYRDYYTNIELGFVNTFHAAKVAYPEQTKSLDIDKKSKEILSKFTNKDDYYTKMTNRMYKNPFQKIENLEQWCKDTFPDKFAKQ